MNEQWSKILEVFLHKRILEETVWKSTNFVTENINICSFPNLAETTKQWGSDYRTTPVFSSRTCVQLLNGPNMGLKVRFSNALWFEYWTNSTVFRSKGNTKNPVFVHFW